MEYKKGFLIAFLGAALFAASDVFVRIGGDELNAWHIMAGRSLVGVLALPFLARCFKLDLLGKSPLILSFTGLIGVIGMTCLMASFLMITLFEALVLLYLHPVVGALLSPFLTKDRLTSRDWASILLAFGGTVLVLWPGEFQARLGWGHLLGLAAAFSNGLYMTLVRRLSPSSNALTPLFYMCFLGVLVAVFPLTMTESAILPGVRGIMAALGCGLFAMGAHLCTNQALKYMASPQVGVIQMGEVLMAGLMGIWFFDELMNWRIALGGALILAGGAALSLRNHKASFMPKPAGPVGS